MWPGLCCTETGPGNGTEVGAQAEASAGARGEGMAARTGALATEVGRGFWYVMEESVWVS